MKSSFYNLASGTKFLFVEDKDSPSVEVSVYFATGATNDSTALSGTAHFLEHLNFQGTVRRPQNIGIVMEIENLGGHFDAFTAQEYTGYSIKSPSGKLIQNVDVLFDLIQNSVFRDEEVKKEADVISEEIKMYEDMPSEKAGDVLQQALFPNHPLGRNIAGSEQTVKSIIRDDLINYRNDFYAQDNILVSVAGKFKTSDIKQILIDKIQAFPLIAIKSKNQGVKKQGRKVINTRKDIQQTNIAIGGYGLPRDNKIAYINKLGNVLLSGGMGSMLFQELREKLRLVYYVQASHQSYTNYGRFQVDLGTDCNKIDQALDRLFSTLQEFIDGKFTDVEFERAKNYLKGLLITQVETSMDIASWNALKLLLNDHVEFETKEDVIAKIEGISKSMMLDTWKRIIHVEDLIISNVGPRDCTLL